MIHRLALVAMTIVLAAPQSGVAQTSPAPAAASGITVPMKAAFTPDVISQVESKFAPLGAFQKLQFVSRDSMKGFTRYHYVAIFANGTQPLMFALDASGNIAGFFLDQGQ